MRGLLDFVKVASVLAAIGGLVWAGFGVIAADPSIVGPDIAESGAMSGGLRFAAIAGVTYIVAAFIRKRMA